VSRFPNRRLGTAANNSASADSAAADSSTAPARHRRLIFSPLTTLGRRGWGRRRNDDRPGSVCFLFFKKMQLHVYIF
jgi:hypothetical protein